MRRISVYVEDLLALLDDAATNLAAVHSEFCGPTSCDCEPQRRRIQKMRLEADRADA